MPAVDKLVGSKTYCYKLTRRGETVQWLRNDGHSGTARIGDGDSPAFTTSPVRRDPALRSSVLSLDGERYQMTALGTPAWV